MMPCSQIHAGHLHVHMCALAIHEPVTTACPPTAGRELSEAQRAGSEAGRANVGNQRPGEARRVGVAVCGCQFATQSGSPAQNHPVKLYTAGRSPTYSPPPSLSIPFHPSG